MTIAQVLARAARRAESTEDGEMLLGGPALEFFLEFIGTPAGRLWGLERSRGEIASWFQSAAEWAKVRGK